MFAIHGSQTAYSQLLPPNSDAKVPLVWSLAHGAYLAPDGSKPDKLDSSIHRIVVPAPNAVWNPALREYQTGDGSRLPAIPHPVTGKRVIPPEAVDFHMASDVDLRRGTGTTSKTPVRYDPQGQSYVDDSGRKLTSWNAATHELIQPRPNVVWDEARQQYVTRDGSPLPWIKDRRGWEGIPVEAIDPSVWDDPKRFRPKPSVQDQTPLDRMRKQLNLYRELDSYQKVFEEARRRGAKVPPQLVESFRRMREGVGNELRQTTPEALQNLESSKNAPPPKKESRPKERVHVSRRAGFGANRLSANEAAAGRQIIGAGANGPQFDEGLIREWKGLVNDAQNPSVFEGGGIEVMVNRIIALGDRTLKEMHRFNAASMDFQSWERSKRVHEESMRLMTAAKNGDASAVNVSVIRLLDELPESIRQPAKKYLKQMDVLYQQEPSTIDPNNPPYDGAAWVVKWGHTTLEHGNVVAGRLRAGITDVQAGIYAATADLFADMIRANPDLRTEIGQQMQRIDSMNDAVHEWGRAQSAVVEQYIRRNEDFEIATSRAVDRATGFSMPVPDVPLRLGGTMFPNSALPMNSGFAQYKVFDQVVNISTGEYGTLGFGSLASWVQAERDERAVARLTLENWYATHRLGDMVEQRLKATIISIPLR